MGSNLFFLFIPLSLSKDEFNFFLKKREMEIRGGDSKSRQLFLRYFMIKKQRRGAIVEGDKKTW